MKVSTALKGSGKLGSTVYSQSGGECIAREYRSTIKNPNTELQVNQRSKLALMSQLSAAMAPVIAIPRLGLKSSRNLFIKKNAGIVSANQGTAQVSYENLQITNGSTALPGVSVTRVAGTSLTLALISAAAADISRVVYCVFRKTSEEKLEYITSLIGNTAGEGRTFEVTTSEVTGELACFAYGMKDLSAAATAKYASYHVANGVDVAGLIASRKITTADIQLTETRGTTLFSNENENVTPDAGQVMVYITAEGPGAVSGTGFSNGRKAVAIGSSVTVTATPQAGMSFLGWKNNGASSYLTTTAEYTFTANAQVDIVAVFSNPDPDPGDDQD